MSPYEVFILVGVVVAGILSALYSIKKRSPIAAILLIISGFAIVFLLTNIDIGQLGLVLFSVISGTSLAFLVVVLVYNIPVAVLYACVALLILPITRSFFRSYMVLVAASALGLLLASSIRSLFDYCWSRNRKDNSKRSRRFPVTGSDTYSHLLYYLGLILVVAAGGFCYEYRLFVMYLAWSYICCALATTGILYETDGFRSLSPISSAFKVD